MLKTVLYDENNCKWIMFGRDPKKNAHVIDTNEYLIVSGNDGILLDPGGIEIFPSVLTAVSENFDIRNIKAYLCSHQDPDVMSSLPLWLSLTPDAKIYLSWLWAGFVSHFGSEYYKNFEILGDDNVSIDIGNKKFELVSAHYCHSPGNFHLFDPSSKIYFCGDMGAALIPIDYPIIVEDFKTHIKYMEKFHQRWMPSNQAKNKWISKVRKLNPKMLCPQHGAIFADENVKNFLDWLEDLEVGIAK